MIKLPHEAFYFNDKDQILGDSDEIEYRLTTLLRDHWTITTQFLVLIHDDAPAASNSVKDRGKSAKPVPFEKSAEVRGEALIKYMNRVKGIDLKGNTKDGHLRLLRWIVDFYVKGEVIPPRDLLAQPDAKARVAGDLRSSVWVFRVDC